MEVLDWDIYAKSYDDTQQLLGRPDLAEKHFEKIGRDQGRDAAFDPVLVFCTNDACESEEDAKRFYLAHANPSEICRSRRMLMQVVAQDPVLYSYLPANSDYLVGPAVDEALFALYLERQRKPLAEVVYTIVQRVTEELIGDVAHGKTLPLAMQVAASSTQSAYAPVVQRPSAVRLASRREYLLELDCSMTLANGQCHLILGTCLDPDQQIRAVYLVAGQQRIEVSAQIVHFARPSKGRKLQSLGLLEDLTHGRIGIGLLVKSDLLGSDVIKGLDVENIAGVSSHVECPHQHLKSLDTEDLQHAWQALNDSLFAQLEGDLAQLPEEWLDASIPVQSMNTNLVQFALEGVHVYQQRLMLFAALSDPDNLLKALYYRQGRSALTRIDHLAARGLTRSDRHGPREFMLASLPDSVRLSEPLQLLGLYQNGHWFRIDTPVDAMSPADVLDKLLQTCEPLHGAVLDRVYQTMVQPIAEPLFSPQRFRNPHYQVQPLAAHRASSQKPTVSALVMARSPDLRLTALLSRLGAQRGQGLTLEVLVQLQELPTHEAFDAFVAQLAWFGLNVQIFVAPEQQGFGRTLNQLARQAAGDWLLTLTGDMVPASGDCLATLQNTFDDTQVGIVFPLVSNTGGTIEAAGHVFERDATDGLWQTRNALQWLPVERIKGHATYEVPFSGLQAAMMRRDVFERSDGFDEQLPDAELCSLDWCLRLWEQGMTVQMNTLAVVTRTDALTNEFSSPQRLQHRLVRRHLRQLLNQRWKALIEDRFAEWTLGGDQHREAQARKRGVMEILRGLR